MEKENVDISASKKPYFQIINNIKYDVGQSTALAECELTSKDELDKSYKRCMFKNVLAKTTVQRSHKSITLRKGVNGHYFLHIICDIQIYNVNHLPPIEGKIDTLSIDKHEKIRVLTIEEAINMYFKGYPQCEFDKQYHTHTVYHVMTLLVSEEEAFGKIEVA